MITATLPVRSSIVPPEAECGPTLRAAVPYDEQPAGQEPAAVGGVAMSWDFETDPEFQEELDWIEDFVRTEIEPLDLVIAALRTT